MSNELILAISGNDIFSGGGLHADLATYTTNKQHGFVAVTCLTAMTEHGFEVIPVDPTTFAQQLNSLKDVPFSAIKLGLLPNVQVADLALDYVKAHAEIPVVLDPVLVCKESHDVEVSALRDELIKFFPYVTIITPNLPEAEILTQSKIQSLDDMKAAARKLHELGACWGERTGEVSDYDHCILYAAECVFACNLFYSAFRWKDDYYVPVWQCVYLVRQCADRVCAESLYRDSCACDLCMCAAGRFD